MLESITLLHRKLNRALCIGFSGAGGKTTSLYNVANELHIMHEKVLITTTTKMFPAENQAEIKIVARETFNENDLNDGCITQWFSRINQEGKGLPPELKKIEELNNYTKLWKLIEIDGSKHLPIKAPNLEEPVYCKGMDLVYGVIGASVFGKPVSKERVHRLERFLEITHTKMGDFISSEVIARLINHPEGLFRGLPKETSACVLFTQVRPEQEAFVNLVRTLTDKPIEVLPWIER
jgi:probable selenium-dependent hydroxylase accessory protein YqeC